MAWYDIFRRHKPQPISPQVSNSISAGVLEDNSEIVHTFDNRNITFSGELTSYDYDGILRDKQRNIYSLFELADYYGDKDPIVRGILKGVYTAFSVTDWKLIGTSDQIKKKYEDYYERINLRDRMASIFYQYYKYANVYIYLQEDGNIVTLPVHKTRISNIMINGEPVLEFNAESVRNDIFIQGTPASKLYIDDDELDIKLYGLPPEVTEGIKKGYQWVQLNPKNTFVLQDLKEDWVRYAIPMIAAMLDGLKKKKLISLYEDRLLNLGINSFIHVRYGNEKNDNYDMMPNREELTAVHNIFAKAMRGSALATTNNYAKAEVIQADTDALFQYDKYKDANSDILSAGGISGIIVTGRAEDGSTFASAQVSINTADKRIELARDNFCELMDKINRRINGDMITRNASERIPKFTLVPLDLSGTAKLQKVCMDLWKEGCVSTETLLQTHGFDFDQEVQRKRDEVKDGSYSLLNKEQLENITKVENDNDTYGKVGRPELDLDERTSDPANAITGKQPKPSNPEGSYG